MLTILFDSRDHQGIGENCQFRRNLEPPDYLTGDSDFTQPAYIGTITLQGQDIVPFQDGIRGEVTINMSPLQAQWSSL